MLAPIHVENSGQLLGANGPICVHFTARNSSHPLRRNWFGLIQEALLNANKPRPPRKSLHIAITSSALIFYVAPNEQSLKLLTTLSNLPFLRLHQEAMVKLQDPFWKKQNQPLLQSRLFHQHH